MRTGLRTGAVKCGLCKYILYTTCVADYVTIRVVHHQVTRLQELTYGSTSFPLGDATGSINWRLYATTGTPLVKTGTTGHYLIPPLHCIALDRQKPKQFI